ncbi:MHYT domain-containing protein [Nocardia camponoti]|uniref:Membrane protein n=1 Tax=Nocardia camponoti TaxID=1616106 RepID=A0A917QCE4_9NOCA|nr:MHYT domain-containing protein [Nocardia camponoti]GGK43292.1 membrane protein [Nocardia camponoti]
MLNIDHFTYGWVTPTFAYLMSVIGSMLALRCMVRSRASGNHGGWLTAAAVALGGTGIWVMHFVAMLGFSVSEATIRYNVPVTLLSAVIAMGVVWLGLSIVVRRGWDSAALPVGGTITGLGVGAMHYAGMYAMRTDVTIIYEPLVVAVSLVIAVAASTAALWFALHIHGIWATIGAALLMGVAVTGMHYTGMMSMSAHTSMHAAHASGATAAQLLTPLIIGISMVTLILLMQVGITEAEDPNLTRPVNGQRASRYWPSGQN